MALFGAVTFKRQLQIGRRFGARSQAQLLTFYYRSRGFAWLSAGIAIAIPSIALWATVWSARSGASQPQLLAVEPVEGLASIWAAAVGAWLLGWPARFTRDAKWPALPTPL